MITMSKSLVGRAALGLVALAGVFAAVPASAHPYGWHGGWRGGWGHERVWVERGYGPAYVEAYRPVPAYAPAYAPPPAYAPAYVPAPVVVWHGHFHHW
jgi:hypothetical protein